MSARARASAAYTDYLNHLCKLWMVSHFIPAPLSPSEQSPIAKPSPIANPSPMAKPSRTPKPSPSRKPAPTGQRGRSHRRRHRRPVERHQLHIGGRLLVGLELGIHLDQRVANCLGGDDLVTRRDEIGLDDVVVVDQAVRVD